MDNKPGLLSLSLPQFIKFLKSEQIKKFFFVYNDEKKSIEASHKKLQSIADYFSQDKRDFIKHEGWFCKISENYEMLLGAFVHRTNRGQAAGGVRFWTYENAEDYFRDGLRLGAGMTFKNAMAGLWWGGGKGVIAHNPEYDKMDSVIREKIYQEYGEFISSLNGCYVTAEDVGTSVDDMANVFSGTRFTTCIPQKFGGSGNPSEPTAKGIISGMEAALDFLNLGTLEEKTVAVQGLGHVGEPLIGLLLDRKVKKVIGTDINPGNIDLVSKKYSDKKLEFHLVKKDDLSIFGLPCDIFSPNATGAILNPTTIPLLKTKIVCGAANNQLADEKYHGEMVGKQGILYAPDYVVNAGGIINVYYELEGYNRERAMLHAEKIYDTTFNLFQLAKKEGIPTYMAANHLAEQRLESIARINAVR